ncbi:MAG: two pore domain potassium channel family protein [Kouleothrix sp.]|nr:two pore domain potassium channel family protein [Kouleothrix sp.]
MRTLVGVIGVALLLVILWDGFETIVLPRRVRSRVRLTRLFYAYTWAVWSAIGRRIHSNDRRDNFLSYFGPLSLLMLLAVWAVGMTTSFALIHWGFSSTLVGPEGQASFGGELYMSGSTFFTLGIGDITPRTEGSRLLTVAEAGTGIAFLALVIGYLPVIYQAFSRREASISLLDARAGSPPAAAELLRRHGDGDSAEAMVQFLRDWERWSAELLESHLSYAVLAYYRSQHDSQSWLASLTMLLDVCALVVAGVDGIPPRPARLAFAMARHAAVDLSQILGTPPRPPAADRLPPSDLARLRAILAGAGVPLREGAAAERKLAEMRAKYEPYVNAMSAHLLMPLPAWLPAPDTSDDWQTSVFEHVSTARIM